MIEVTGLVKKFGEVIAVDRISFSIGKGEIFGLIGENGAGKTTTLRILATMLKPTEGTVSMNGYDVVRESEKVREHISILFGGETGLYDRLTAAENISYFGQLNGMDEKTIKSRIEHFERIFSMKEYMNRRAAKLSKGMKQKVAFARSIIHNPDVMLFDEPTSGLDVSAVRDVHDFISDCKNDGKTIIFSSHSMKEIEKLCDRIGIIHKGRLIFCGSLDDFKVKYGSSDLEEIFIELVGAQVEV